ncbi:MAG TPA: acyl carrier protein [Candidatus Limnocylindrales bacterium]|nr:acyl carrier protein [Candidatus Limnocylindrales bacterium]
MTDADQNTMATLWGEVLGCPPPGPDEDFFDLGGQSIIAARLVRAVQQTFGVRVPLHAVFDHPTVPAFTEFVLARQV